MELCALLETSVINRMSINIKISVGWLFLNYQQTFAFDFCQLVVWTTVVTLDWAYQTISIQSEPVCLRLFLTDISSCTLLIKIYLSYFLTVWTILSQSPSSKKWLNFKKWKSLFYNCNYICNLWRHVKTCKFVYKITVCVFSFEASSSNFASTHASMSKKLCVQKKKKKHCVCDSLYQFCVFEGCLLYLKLSDDLFCSPFR